MESDCMYSFARFFSPGDGEEGADILLPQKRHVGLDGLVQVNALPLSVLWNHADAQGNGMNRLMDFGLLAPYVDFAGIDLIRAENCPDNFRPS